MIRWLGFILVISGAAATGILMASDVKNTLKLYRQTLPALAYMKSEIEFHLTPLDKILLHLAKSQPKNIASGFGRLHDRMQTRPGVNLGMHASFAFTDEKNSYPAEWKTIMTNMFHLLGKQDVLAQIRAIELAEQNLNAAIDRLHSEKKERCRTYRTFGFCAGLAVAVILI